MPVDPAPLLRITNLSVRFGSGDKAVPAVRGVSLTVDAGEAVGLVGESGSGKSTVARAVAGLTTPTAGSIRFNARRSVQMIFQDPAGSLNPKLRLWAIVTEPLRVAGDTVARKDRRTRAADLFESVGLQTEALDRYPHQLSGGQRQRVAIARAISTRPKLIICDEPTSALDVSVQAQVVNLLRDLQERFGLAYLFISHDLAVVDHLCTQIYVMKSGEIVESGPRERIIDAPEHVYTQALLDAARASAPPLVGQAFSG